MYFWKLCLLQEVILLHLFLDLHLAYTAVSKAFLNSVFVASLAPFVSHTILRTKDH